MTTTQAALLEALTPCPFCGNRPTLTVRPHNAEASEYFAAVSCFCGGYSACAHKMATAPEAADAEAMARAAWNGRAADAAQPEPVARWPFVESPGAVAARLEAALQDFDGYMLGAVRNVFIEGRLALAAPPQPAPIAAQADDELLKRLDSHEYWKVTDAMEVIPAAAAEIRRLRAALAAQAGPALVPLTDEQISDCAWGYFPDSKNLPEAMVEFARAIERAHGIGAPASTRPADASIPGRRGDMAPPSVVAALRFYAQRQHFVIADSDAWDTVSGEPPNYWCDDAGTATVEDGAIARIALEALAAAPQAPAEQPQGPSGPERLAACRARELRPDNWVCDCEPGQCPGLPDKREEDADPAPAEPAAQEVRKCLAGSDCACVDFENAKQDCWYWNGCHRRLKETPTPAAREAGTTAGN